MKKISILTLALLSLAACSPESAPEKAPEQSPAAASSASSASAPQSSSAPVAAAASHEHAHASAEYHVGIDVGSPPFSMRDEQGQPSGFEVDLLNAIAAKQHIKLVFLHDKRSDLFTNIVENKYQMIAASLETNPDNAAKFDLSQPYAKSYRAIASRNSKPAKSFADLKTSGGKVAVQDSTVSERVLKELGANTVGFPNLYAGFNAFMRGETDYIVGNSIPLGYYVKQQNNAELNMVAYDATAGTNNLVFAIKKGNTELLNHINAGLDSIKKDGTYDKIYEKWFKDNTEAKI